MHQLKLHSGNFLQSTITSTGGLSTLSDSPESEFSFEGFRDLHTPEQQNERLEQASGPDHGLDPSTTHLQQLSCSAGSPRGRPHGDNREQETALLSVPEPRPSGSGLQCSNLGLEPMVADLHLSTTVAHSTNHEETSDLPSSRSDNTAQVHCRDVVPIHPGQIAQPVGAQPVRSNEE